MTSTPPMSPTASRRPMSMVMSSRPSRSSSRMSMSKGSRASDEDSRTSVKVVVRVRPALKPADPGFELIPQRFQHSIATVTSPTSLSVDSPQGRKLFVFDRVFGEEVGQDGLWEYLSESVNSFVQGYNVSILAYGQSGAGKSFTMGTAAGEQTNPEVMGIVPRAAYALFEKLTGKPEHSRTGSASMTSILRTPQRYSTSSAGIFSPKAHKDIPEKGWELKATYVEIYNEQLRDLLLPDTIPPNERNNVTIREDTRGRILLTGLRQVTINSVNDLLQALNFGSSIRQTDATNVNAKSSRSHAVFSLNLVLRKGKGSPSAQDRRMSMPVEALDSHVTVDSKLHFVDLAGSERLKNTGAVGERAREGISINAGLAALGKVISQLSSQKSGSHVSYRDSRLTRLLQDSLGGNAITYMIACVTPAEFHLSETLNTVQYAQRARAIQIKPKIQQVNDESDKQAVIDRLKAEVAFLRAQIRSSETKDHTSSPPPNRIDRPNTREIELQNHILDMQESYNALSQRHANLISEISKAREGQTEDTPTLNDAVGESAIERLKRSNSFAEAVEKVVLEYEKTIQSLEASLSSTRTSLASTESCLLERESKCAYIETVNQQLQTRLQKLADRETSTETYLHDLEAKLDGHTSGEEKNATIIAELRKEIARIRENETSSEEYIATLEERLAEADQDMEAMQHEVDRLEHLVQRQRSLGQLDKLLVELDKSRNGNTIDEDSKDVAEVKAKHRRTLSSEALKYAIQTPIPELDDEAEYDGTEPAQRLEEESKSLQVEPQVPVSAELEPILKDVPADDDQSNTVDPELVTVTQELFDLKVEHESTVNDYELLSAKYEEALRTLAELQDAVDEARHPAPPPNVATPTSTRPSSFLGAPRVEEIKLEGQLSSSCSLSSELSLAGESPSSEIEVETTRDFEDMERRSQKERLLIKQMEALKRLQAEKEEGMITLTEQYAKLQEQHRSTLDIVEGLQAELSKTKLATPPSPHVIRRKSSQNMLTIDRAHRSLASLRNIASEEFENKPETMQNFDVNLNTAMHELHVRSERIQALEAELSSVKKEIEAKTKVISGLARERSSMHGSPTDLSMVSSMRDQLLQSENEIRVLREASSDREKELLERIDGLKKALAAHENPGEIYVPEPPYSGRPEEPELKKSPVEDHEKKIVGLQEEVMQWQCKHRAACESLQATEERLQHSLVDLEIAKASIEEMRSEKSAHEKEDNSRAQERVLLTAQLDKERKIHQEIVATLQKELDGHRTALDERTGKIAELEASLLSAQQQFGSVMEQFASVKAQMEEGAKSHDADQNELAQQQELIQSLEQQLHEQNSAVESHQEAIKSLEQARTQEIDELRKSITATEGQLQTQLVEETTRYENALTNVKAELDNSKREMAKLLEEVSQSLGEPTTADVLQDRLQELMTEKSKAIEDVAFMLKVKEEAEARLAEANIALDELDQTKAILENRVQELEGDFRVNGNTSEYMALQEETAAIQSRNQELESVVQEQVVTIDEMSKKMEAMSAKEEKLSRLVDELEEQIASSYEQQQAVTNRQSILQEERARQLEEAIASRAVLEKDLDDARNRIDELEMQFSMDRPMSPSAIRKSTSAATLPSPPPAIPLPPLPAVMSAVSPPSSRHVSKDMASIQHSEEQEARIRKIEQHLHAEKQLTATLEEALSDLEGQTNKLKTDLESWKKKAWAYEDELKTLRAQKESQRLSIQQMESERNARKEAEAARAHLEEKMAALNKKKKKSTLNCF